MNGPIAWFARNHVAANLLLGVIVLAGLASLPRIPTACESGVMPASRE